MAKPNELENFRKQWKNELSTVASTSQNNLKKANDDVASHNSRRDDQDKKPQPESGLGIVLYREKAADVHPVAQKKEVCDNDERYYPFMILGQLLKDGANAHSSDKVQTSCKDSPKSDSKRKYFEADIPIDHAEESVRFKKKICDLTNTSGQKDIHSKTKLHVESNDKFLDIFISDLDEINEIPFFDTSLPREVAVNIFKHLSIKDLCHCAQVSRSWRSLADDELLWCRVCHRRGYEQDLRSSEKENWKQLVQQHISLGRQLITNWKGRLGRLSSLQHTQGGVLCVVNSCQDTVVAGYSNGDVKLWDVQKGDNCILQPSSTALRINDAMEEGTVANYVLHVDTSPQVTVASYSHRHVDVWLNDRGIQPVKTFHCEGGWDISDLKLVRHSAMFALAQGYYVRVYAADSNMDFTMVDKIDLNKMVSHIKWLESPQSHPSTHILAIATPNIISMYKPESGAEHLSEVHNMIDSPVTCFDLRPDSGQMGVACGMFGGPTEAFNVHMYDIASCRLMTSLQGHTWMVTCINMADSPAHKMVTGCGDRKVRVYDTRASGTPVMTLVGHCGKITTVQMDEWKVVSGDEGGFVRVWDQRMRTKLWEWYNSHPVQHCHFTEGLLVVANVPYDKFPVLDDPFERVTHTRYRGTVQMYDFSADQTTQGLPEICFSSYDQPESFNYNIGLAMPYDTI